MVSPRLMSPSFVCHTTFPVSASSATVTLSSRLKTILPSAYDAPRLTMSQQASPCEAGSGLGR